MEKNTKTHKTHWVFSPVGIMNKVEVYKQKTQKHMEDVGCVSCDPKKKHKNTQNTCLVHLSFWSWRKTQKHAKYKGGCPCSVWASPHVYNKTQKIQKTKPKKYKNTSNTGLLQFLNGIKNTQNTWVVWTSLQYCLLAHLHVGVKKYKNTQWLTNFFCIHGKKNTKIHKTQKTHWVILCPITSHI